MWQTKLLESCAFRRHASISGTKPSLMTLSMPDRSRRIYPAVFLISASILMLELVLTRIFSVKLYYHYAFMVISLALLGSGASGVYIYLFPDFFKRERLEKHLCF